MKTNEVLRRFASLLERHLPMMSELHRHVREAGFAAWDSFITERLALLPDDDRDEELQCLLLSCREEFCNFARYTRDTAGDGLQLQALHEQRQRARLISPAGPIHLLRSDARMRADTSLAIRYASDTRRAASAALEVERSRLLDATRAAIGARPAASMNEHVRTAIDRCFDAAGFTSRPAALSHVACFEKALTPSATAVACLEGIDGLGAVGWRGDIGLSFYARPGSTLEAHYVKTCCKGLAALPWRLGGLVPGVDAYKTGTYFLASSVSRESAGDVVTLTVYDGPPTSQEAQARVVAHVTLAVNCFLTIFSLVEPALIAAAIELDQTA